MKHLSVVFVFNPVDEERLSIHMGIEARATISRLYRGTVIRHVLTQWQMSQDTYAL